MNILHKALTLILFTPLILLGMEERKPNRSRGQRNLKSYIKLDDSIVRKRVPVPGCNLNYYKEYHVESDPENNRLFPVNCCDPLELHKVGKANFFITSAFSGRFSYPGTWIKIDDNFTNVVAVRMKGEPMTVHIYAGYNSESFTIVDNKKIYEGHLLAVVAKNIRHIEIDPCIYFYGGARYLKCLRVDAMYARDHVPIDLQDADWNSIELQEALLEAFGGNHDCFTNPNVANCYWDNTGNKLKGIKYNRQQNK